VLHILINPAGQNDANAATENAVKGACWNAAPATDGTRPKAEVGDTGKPALRNVEITGAARLYRAASGGPKGYASVLTTYEPSGSAL
jgi:hypothetical protein